MLSPLGIVALVCCALSAIVLLGFLIRRPPLTVRVRLALLFAIGVLPLAATATSNAYALHRTTEREFCGSCHVMATHLEDAVNPESNSLAARHTRNKFTGEQSCYVCHSDYSALGYPLTKLHGLNHVYQYYLNGYRQMPLEQFHREVRVAKPYPNSNCMQCHSGGLDTFQNVREHRALQADLISNTVSCASAGCHGYSHPFNKTEPPAAQAHK